jgi:hypothetical protein
MFCGTLGERRTVHGHPTNETPQPNENKRQRTQVEMPNIAGLSDAVPALVTACSEVGRATRLRRLIKKVEFLNQ